MPPTRKAKARKRLKAAKPAKASLVLITGLSGSGKASVLKAFEDLGYYCVDNLPIELIPRFAELAQNSEYERTALVVDIREGDSFRKLPQILKSLKTALDTKVIFLEASDDALI